MFVHVHRGNVVREGKSISFSTTSLNNDLKLCIWYYLQHTYTYIIHMLYVEQEECTYNSALLVGIVAKKRPILSFAIMQIVIIQNYN